MSLRVHLVLGKSTKQRHRLHPSTSIQPPRSFGGSNNSGVTGATVPGGSKKSVECFQVLRVSLKWISIDISEKKIMYI